MSTKVRESQLTSGKPRKTHTQTPTATDGEWAKLLKLHNGSPTEAAFEWAKRHPIDWASDKLKTDWTGGLESIYWIDVDWRLLPPTLAPNLWKHDHTDGYGGPLQRIILPRCQHGVYLTNRPIAEPKDIFTGRIYHESNYEGTVTEWKAPRCSCCWPETWFYEALLEARKRHKKRGTLLDKWAWAEVFTKPIKTKRGKYTDDLRLQEDPETGKPRLETMGGYVMKGNGYGKAGMGYGPDSEADDIRAAWQAGSENTSEDSPENTSEDNTSEDSPEDSAIGHGDHDQILSREGWVGTLPSVYPPCLLGEASRYPDMYEQYRSVGPFRNDWEAGVNSFRKWRGITEENWQPPSLPIVTYVVGGLYDREIHENTIEGLGLTEGQFFGDQRTLRGRIGTSYPKPIPPDKRQEYPNLDNWHSPLEWVLPRGRWQARLDMHSGPYDSERRNCSWECRFDLQSGTGSPTPKHEAQWRRKPEYQRGGGVYRIPRRRTPHWPKNWRTERAMQDTSSHLKMYRHGAVCAAKTTSRWAVPSPSEIQVETMRSTANENYRQARLALTKNHGVVGFWRTNGLGGNERSTAVEMGCGGKSPQIVAGNYGHRLEDGRWSDVEDGCVLATTKPTERQINPSACKRWEPLVRKPEQWDVNDLQGIEPPSRFKITGPASLVRTAWPKEQLDACVALAETIRKKEAANGLAIDPPTIVYRYDQKTLCKQLECPFIHDHNETCDEVKQRLGLRPLPPVSVVYSRCVQASRVPK